jgi:hypothetical protein
MVCTTPSPAYEGAVHGMRSMVSRGRGYGTWYVGPQLPGEMHDAWYVPVPLERKRLWYGADGLNGF